MGCGNQREASATEPAAGTSTNYGSKLAVTVKVAGDDLHITCLNWRDEQVLVLEVRADEPLSTLEEQIKSATGWKAMRIQDGRQTVGKDGELIRDFSKLNITKGVASGPAVVTQYNKVCEDSFGINVTLENGQLIRVEGLTEYDKCLVAKTKVFETAGLDMGTFDDYVLVFFEQFMQDEFQLNYFGLPWNGTDCTLQSKKARQEIYNVEGAEIQKDKAFAV
eukprot:TRINITY_DN9211_c0_g1_i1.p1 TRINITY_DN9211_c0_g1~~TRINITY_DN9211_c0_g1_i1.p1  ORF type:complete len:221 (-),score=52.79 TRINITY_DN9211_c0_g1_i1:138-800(-)